jgi:hypothetical protein
MALRDGRAANALLATKLIEVDLFQVRFPPESDRNADIAEGPRRDITGVSYLLILQRYLFFERLLRTGGAVVP